MVGPMVIFVFVSSCICIFGKAEPQVSVLGPAAERTLYHAIIPDPKFKTCHKHTPRQCNNAPAKRHVTTVDRSWLDFVPHFDTHARELDVQVL